MQVFESCKSEVLDGNKLRLEEYLLEKHDLAGEYVDVDIHTERYSAKMRVQVKEDGTFWVPDELVDRWDDWSSVPTVYIVLPEYEEELKQESIKTWLDDLEETSEEMEKDE